MSRAADTVRVDDGQCRVRPDDWGKLVGGGFAHLSAPFAIHPSDKKRARDYRDQAKAAGLGWSDVKGQVNGNADKQGWTDDKRAEEMKRVRKYFGKHLGG